MVRPIIAGATFTIEQAGAQPCSYTIDPTDTPREPEQMTSGFR